MKLFDSVHVGLIAGLMMAGIAIWLPAAADPVPDANEGEPAANVDQTPDKKAATEPASTSKTSEENETPATPDSETLADAAAEPKKPAGLGAKVRAALNDRPDELRPEDRAAAESLIAYYETNDDKPIWISNGTLNAKAKAAIDEIKKADDWGLEANKYDLPLMSDIESEEAAAEAELQLSLAVLSYARDARGGRIPEPTKQLSSYIDRAPQLLDPAEVMSQLAAASDPAKTLRGFHPQHPQFEKMRQRMLALRNETAETETVTRIPAGPVLGLGRKHANVVLLRERLEVPKPEPKVIEEVTEDGDLRVVRKPVDETVFDKPLADAVKAFQKEKGLYADGMVGPRTRAALNDIEVPSPEKIRANMEQWRWMPTDMGAYHIWVNIPEFMVRVIKNGEIVHEERVITGLTDKQTPLFSDEIELVTLNPSWGVPNSIKVNELYPSLARGGSYFRKQGLRLYKNGRQIDPYSVNWSTTDIRKFDVKQPPGKANVLGAVKMSFPNKHLVYMHDTPTKHLFNASSRTFSHGCIRVRDPMRLAELILEADQGMTPEDVHDMRGSGKVEKPIKLESMVPVHITYFTSWIDDDGTELRFKDVYGHEQRIVLALEGRFADIDIGKDHLAPVKAPKAVYGGDNALEIFFTNLFGGF